jgi:methionyl-tRNA formyltransferase
MIRQITLADQPILRRKLKPVKNFDHHLRSLVQDLIDTMIFANGAGLAANQIGVDQQVFVTGLGGKPKVFINPKLKILASKDSEIEEGCLSVPGYRGPVKRTTEVEITFDDLKGRRKKLQIKGYLARVLQHETDHLNGKLYVDRIEDKSKIQEVEPIRIAFFGSGEFAVPILVSLVGLNWTFDFQTVGVITQPPRPSGRDKELTKTPAHQAADSFKLPVLTPEKLDQDLIEKLKEWKVDLIILADYGKILPKELIEFPKEGSLAIHPSLLPKYRGASPIQHTILNGDDKTGTTLLKIAPEFDTGGVIGQYETAIKDTDTYLSLRDHLAQLSAVMIRDLLPYYVNGELEPKPQAEESVTKAPKITPELGKIESNDSAETIVRKVHALNPDPGVYMQWKGKRVKILAAHLEEEKLVLDEVQMEGSKAMSFKDFHNGHPDFSLPQISQ